MVWGPADHLWNSVRYLRWVEGRFLSFRTPGRSAVGREGGGRREIGAAIVDEFCHLLMHLIRLGGFFDVETLRDHVFGVIDEGGNAFDEFWRLPDEVNDLGRENR